MSHNKIENRLVKIFNRNIPVENIHSEQEIKNAFQKESYSSGTEKEQQLYIRFFKDCNNDNDVNELIKLCNTSITKLKKLYMSYEKHRKIEFGFFWSTRFNLPKIKGKIASRSDYIYEEIDEFGIYELTPCIAYEMAIRNPEVEKLLNRHKKISEMCNDINYLMHRSFTKNSFSWWYGITDEKILEEKYNEYIALYNKKQHTYEVLIKNDYKNFIDNYIDKCTELGITTLLDLKKMITNELINKYLIYPTGHRVQEKSVKTLYQKEITNKKEAKCKYTLDDNSEFASTSPYRSEIITYDEFTQDQRVTLDGTITLNHVFPNFSRQVYDEFEMLTTINFALPLKEIMDYIEKIKTQICPKIPSELLGETLKKADDITRLTTTDSKGKQIVLDLTRGDEPQRKFGDLLYIYDMKKKGFTNLEIIEEINTHNSDSKITGMSEHTLKKYFTIAEDFIENTRYKELITGKVAN